jgi:DNA-binding response OmpR family regulator
MNEQQKPYVLVVDDEEGVRQLVTRILTGQGYEVAEAANGKQAVESISARRPDLLILDLMMPELDGWAVLERLRERGVLPPALLLTARSDYPTLARSVREGAVAFVGKPFRIQELVNACRKILDAAARPALAVPAERRRNARRQFLAEVKVFSRDRAPIAVGEIVNLSLAGAQLDLEGGPLPPGERIRIAFLTSGDAGPRDLECEVMWWRGSSSQRVSHGLAFRDLGPEAQRQLAELLGG